jgi:predicted small secreted protein
MSWKKLLVGASLGAAATMYYFKQSKDTSLIPAEKALKMVKEQFKEKAVIDGSWIHIVPESIEKYNLPYTVYRGGISQVNGHEQQQIEFLVDAKNGSVIEVLTTS